MSRYQDNIFWLGPEDVPLEEVMCCQKHGEVKGHRSHEAE